MQIARWIEPLDEALTARAGAVANVAANRANPVGPRPQLVYVLAIPAGPASSGLGTSPSAQGLAPINSGSGLCGR